MYSKLARKWFQMSGGGFSIFESERYFLTNCLEVSHSWKLSVCLGISQVNFKSPASSFSSKHTHKTRRLTGTHIILGTFPSCDHRAGFCLRFWLTGGDMFKQTVVITEIRGWSQVTLFSTQWRGYQVHRMRLQRLETVVICFSELLSLEHQKS